MRWTRTAAVSTTALLALAFGAAGCGVFAGDRSGGRAGAAVRVLTLAQPNDSVPTEVAAWVAEVDRESKGSVRIDVKVGWRSGEPEAETGIVNDVGNGKADLAWVGARAFDKLGITSFQPLLAPMLVDSQALQAKVFTAGIPAKMVRGVDSAGLVGLGVLPGPMRKVLGVAHPFARPADFAGQVVGVQDGEVADRSIAALGATPRAMPSGARLAGLDGYEQQLESIYGNHYELSAKYVTSNLDLWPRPMVIFGNRHILAALTPGQREALQRAAERSLPATLKAAKAEDDRAVTALCKAGMTFPVAAASDLRALEVAFGPVYQRLDADPATRAVIESIRSLKSALDTPPDAATCTDAERSAGGGTTAIPDGDYQMALTDAEARRCPEDATQRGGPFEIQLRHGRITEYEQRVGDARGVGWLGTYQVFRDRLELTADGGATGLTANWSFDGTRLTLTAMHGGTCGDATVWTTHPWVLVGANAATPSIPDGTYRSTRTAAESSACPGAGTQQAAVLELVLRGGHVQQYALTPGQPRQLGWIGTYRVFRDRLELTEDGTGHTMTAVWSFDGTTLTLSDLRNGACDDAETWTLHPWVALKPGAASGQPSGEYTSTVTKADWVAKRLTGTVGTFTLVFGGGWVTLTEPGGSIGFTGTYSIFRDRLQIVNTDDTVTATWSLSGGRLTLADVASGGCSDCGPYAVVLGSHPWSPAAA